MCKRVIIIILMLIAITGCRWVDDFRAREQPQYLEQTSRPTLNRESEDYKGNDTNKTEEIEKKTKLPSIDSLSDIPELPEYPAGV